MDITGEQADYLLGLPKKIVVDEDLKESVSLTQIFPFNQRFDLISEDDDEFSFLWEFKQSRKNAIKVSFHCQDNDSKIGLLRLDYNSGHKNPVQITPFVPQRFRPYAGKYFSPKESHVHYHVQGYKTLAWAIPLHIDNFEVNQLDKNEDFNRNFAKIIGLFAKRVNVKTKITVDGLLLL